MTLLLKPFLRCESVENWNANPKQVHRDLKHHKACVCDRAQNGWADEHNNRANQSREQEFWEKPEGLCCVLDLDYF
jgi:hypothetical protein